MTFPATADKTVPRVYGEGIFASCTKLEKVTILDDMTGIPNSMFSGCNALKTLLFPAKMKKMFLTETVLWKIGSPSRLHLLAIMLCVCETLKKLTFLQTLTSIGSCAFQYCDGLTVRHFPGLYCAADMCASVPDKPAHSLLLRKELFTMRKDSIMFSRENYCKQQDIPIQYN